MSHAICSQIICLPERTTGGSKPTDAQLLLARSLANERSALRSTITDLLKVAALLLLAAAARWYHTQHSLQVTSAAAQPAATQMLPDPAAPDLLDLSTAGF